VAEDLVELLLQQFKCCLGTAGYLVRQIYQLEHLTSEVRSYNWLYSSHTPISSSYPQPESHDHRSPSNGVNPKLHVAARARGQAARRTCNRGRPARGRAGSLLARPETYRADVRRFATEFCVPFDNNQAERDVRMVKLQQQISGGWRSETGTHAFFDVRP
jgi:hypothetical protein